MVKREKRTTVTSDVKTVVGWGDAVTEWIWGFGTLSDAASRERAHAFVTVSSKIYCNGCGKSYGAHKSDFQDHLKSNKICTELRGKCFRYDANGHDSMLRE